MSEVKAWCENFSLQVTRNDGQIWLHATVKGMAGAGTPVPRVTYDLGPPIRRVNGSLSFFPSLSLDGVYGHGDVRFISA